MTIIGATNVVHFCTSVKVCRERPVCRSAALQIQPVPINKTADWQVSAGHLHLSGFDSLPLIPKEKAPLRGAFSFGAGYGNRLRICGANPIEQSASSCRLASVHWTLALKWVRFPPQRNKKSQHPYGCWLFLWSRVRESNPPLWLGKRPFYR